MSQEESPNTSRTRRNGRDESSGQREGGRQSGREFTGLQREPRMTGDKVDQAAALLRGERVDQGDDNQGGRRQERQPQERRERERGDGRNNRQENPPGDDENRPFLELDEDEDGKPRQKKERKKGLQDLADEFGLNVKELYDLAVPLDEGEEPMTVGQLKDRVREVRDFERTRDDFEDYHETAMNEVVEARTQIDGVLSILAQTVPKETLARAFSEQVTRYNDNVARAQQQIREYFPEWEDPAKKAADKKAFTEMLGSYGFNKHEVENVMDARLIRFGIHAMRLMARYKRLKEDFTREKTPSSTPASGRRAPAPNRQQAAQRQAQAGDKLGAVATLLGEK